jgi:Peroxin-3
MNSFYAAVGYVGRNKRRFALMSAACACTVGAFVYARQQYNAITAALDAERVNGARSLRAVYTASRKTVEFTLRALLRPGRDRVFACDASNPDALVDYLKRVKDDAEKRQTWDQLKVAAIVRLVSSVYYLVEVYLILLVQVNLVARYSTADVDAPIEELARGKLDLEAKQNFLSLARRRLFEQGGIESLVAVVEEATAEIVRPVRLTERVGPDDVRSLLRRICRLVEAKSAATGTASAGVDSATGVDPSRNDVLAARWLLAAGADGVLEGMSSNSSDSVCDANVAFLVDEGLDLCDVLQYDEVLRTSVDALMDVAGGLVDASLWGVASSEKGGKVAFAPVIARIANVSKLVLHGGAGTARNERFSRDLSASGDAIDAECQADGPFVDALLQVASCDSFGAAVFLSGERATSR